MQVLKGMITKVVGGISKTVQDWTPVLGSPQGAIATASEDSVTGEIVNNKSTGGAARTETQAGSVWSYGGWPQTQYASGLSTGGATADNTQIYEITDARMYGYHTFENTSATDPMDVYVSLDGTNYLASASAVMLHDATASTTFVLTIPAGDVGILEGCFYSIKVLKDGATAETPALRYAHTVK